MNLGDFMEDFNDCSYGCSHLQQMPEQQKKLADELNQLLIAKTHKWRYQISFDYNRLPELMEGWWPVEITGILDDWNKVEGRFVGYIHTGNCD